MIKSKNKNPNRIRHFVERVVVTCVRVDRHLGLGTVLRIVCTNCSYTRWLHSCAREWYCKTRTANMWFTSEHTLFFRDGNCWRLQKKRKEKSRPFRRNVSTGFQYSRNRRRRLVVITRVLWFTPKRVYASIRDPPAGSSPRHACRSDATLSRTRDDKRMLHSGNSWINKRVNAAAWSRATAILTGKEKKANTRLLRRTNSGDLVF